MRNIQIKFTGLIIIICLFSNIAKGQRGGRLGMVTGVSAISINNPNDLAADDKKLAVLPTKGVHYGVEVGYNFRYFGISAQLLRSQAGQKYLIGSSLPEQTRFVYAKPTILFHFNSNPKNDVRFSGYLGTAYGMMTKFTEDTYFPNPVTGQITTSNWTDKQLTLTDTGVIKADVTQQIYATSDLSLILALGTEVRLAKRWLLGMHARMDMGLQPIENLNKLTLKYQDADLGSVINYEHWKNTPYKYTKDLTYTKVRAESKNMSMGVFISLKYILFSGTIYDYEMEGY
jgi:hypothetical protein